jgi:hypothetical protein
MPEANISTPTDDETTAPAERAQAAAAGDPEKKGPAPALAQGDEGRRQPSADPEDPAEGGHFGDAEETHGVHGAEKDEGAAGTERAAGTDEGESGEDGHAADDVRTGLTPRQARRIRAIVSGVVTAAVAVALVVRLGSAPSVLTVGFYGIALILSGVAIGLSRRGRTRVATGVLALGFASVALAEWLLASVE